MTQRPLRAGEPWKVVCADALKLLPTLPDAWVDTVVCDPPYGIDFQTEAWDGRAIRRHTRRTTGKRVSNGQAFEHWTTSWATELAQVVKPGGHIACFAAPRMAHRLTSGLEDAGLEVRDVLMWLHGEGMPKSRRLPGGTATALKPAYEPIILARTPLTGTSIANLEQWGTGALNTQACAIPDPAGGAARWPAHVCLSHHPCCRPGRCRSGCPARELDGQTPRLRASRLFFCAKASRRERDAGCDRLPRRTLDLFPSTTRRGATVRNPHPTVKPLALMRWLVRLVAPDDGLVLDPFCGSGTTGAAARLEGRRFLGIELDEGYAQIARARIAHATETGERS